MSCTAENIDKEEEKYEKLTVNRMPISVEGRSLENGFIRASVERDSPQNGLIMASPKLCIDESVLVDPKLLFIGSKIVEGSHATVYEGRFGVHIVAIKVFNFDEESEEKALLESLFVREVTMMSRVKHENVVEFIGACKDPLMVIVTDFLPRMTLRKYLLNKRPEKLDLHVALSFALDIARAMDYLHANGIIHTDLKPDNLLLTADEKSVKLADFGRAREESFVEIETAETGTYRWMAPEMYNTVTLRQGEKQSYNNKVDVYSFGMVLWGLLTNRMPFEGMSNLQAAYAVAFKQKRPSLPDDISPDLAFIIQSCWAEDPIMRPSFSLIIQMLHAFLSPPPAPSLPEPNSYKAPATSTVTITKYSATARGKFAFLRQLFAAKKARSSRLSCFFKNE